MRLDVYCDHCGSVEPHNTMNTREGAWRYCWACKCAWDPSGLVAEPGAGCLAGTREALEQRRAARA